MAEPTLTDLSPGADASVAQAQQAACNVAESVELVTARAVLTEALDVVRDAAAYLGAPRLPGANLAGFPPADAADHDGFHTALSEALAARVQLAAGNAGPRGIDGASAANSAGIQQFLSRLTLGTADFSAQGLPPALVARAFGVIHRLACVVLGAMPTDDAPSGDVTHQAAPVIPVSDLAAVPLQFSGMNFNLPLMPLAATLAPSVPIPPSLPKFPLPTLPGHPDRRFAELGVKVPLPDLADAPKEISPSASACSSMSFSFSCSSSAASSQTSVIVAPCGVMVASNCSPDEPAPAAADIATHTPCAGAQTELASEQQPPAPPSDSDAGHLVVAAAPVAAPTATVPLPSFTLTPANMLYTPPSGSMAPHLPARVSTATPGTDASLQMTAQQAAGTPPNAAPAFPTYPHALQQLPHGLVHDLRFQQHVAAAEGHGFGQPVVDFSILHTYTPPLAAGAANVGNTPGSDGGLYRKSPRIGRVCYSCGTTETPKWRKSVDRKHVFCNACGLQKFKQRARAGKSPPLTPSSPMVKLDGLESPGHGGSPAVAGTAGVVDAAPSPLHAPLVAGDAPSDTGGRPSSATDSVGPSAPQAPAPPVKRNGPSPRKGMPKGDHSELSRRVLPQGLVVATSLPSLTATPSPHSPVNGTAGGSYMPTMQPFFPGVPVYNFPTRIDGMSLTELPPQFMYGPAHMMHQHFPTPFMASGGHPGMNSGSSEMLFGFHQQLASGHHGMLPGPPQYLMPPSSFPVSSAAANATSDDAERLLLALGRSPPAQTTTHRPGNGLSASNSVPSSGTGDAKLLSPSSGSSKRKRADADDSSRATSQPGSLCGLDALSFAATNL